MNPSPITIVKGSSMTTSLPQLMAINGQPTCLSTDVARHFGKAHKDVLKAIRNLDCSPDFYQRNFAPVIIEYQNGKGGTQKAPAFRITRDGFVFLAGGFTGKKAAQFKESYIAAFNRMEAELSGQRIQQAIPMRPRPAYMAEPWYAILRQASAIMTHVALARALGIHPSTLRKALNGTNEYGSHGRVSTAGIARRVQRTFCGLRAKPGQRRVAMNTGSPRPTVEPQQANLFGDAGQPLDEVETKMHPEQIKAEIRMAGLTATEVARQLNLSRMTVSQVIRGTGRSARVEQRISEIIEKPVDVIWPNRKKSSR